jgi:GT2 family glycosyltransferase
MELDLILPSSMMVRRETFLRVGMFDPDLYGFEDFDLTARLRREGRFIFIEKPGFCYRVHSHAQSASGGMKIIRSRERFLLKMQELYRNEPAKQDLIRQMLADCYSDWGMTELKAGHAGEAREKLRRSLRYNPTKFRTYSRLVRSLWG